MNGFGRVVLAMLCALLWVPVTIVLSLARQGPEALIGFFRLAPASEWLSLFPTAPAGLPLAIACWAIWRLNRRYTAVATFIVLAPLTVAAALIGGILGPIGILVYATVVSVPAWGIHAILRWRQRG